MEELKWMYPAIDREDFQKRVTYAEKLLEKYGAEYVCDYDEKALWMLKDGTHAYENVHKRVYRLNNEYIRVDRVFFTKKPFIVLEFSDKTEGPYEDADPFPYDLPESEFEKEIRFALGIDKD